MNKGVIPSTSVSGLKTRSPKSTTASRSTTPPPTLTVSRLPRPSSISDQLEKVNSSSSRPTSPSITKSVSVSRSNNNSPAKHRSGTPTSTTLHRSSSGSSLLHSGSSFKSPPPSKILPVSTPPHKDPDLYDKNGKLQLRSPTAQKAFLRPALMQLGEVPRFISSGVQTLETIEPNQDILFISAKEVDLLKNERKDSDELIEETVATIELLKVKYDQCVQEREAKATENKKLIAKHEQLIAAHEELSKQNHAVQNELLRVKKFQIEFEQYVKDILIRYEEQKMIIAQQTETIQTFKQQTVEMILEKDQLQQMYEQVCFHFKEQQQKKLQEEAVKQLELQQSPTQPTLQASGKSTPPNTKNSGISPIREDYGVSEEKHSRSVDGLQNNKKKVQASHSKHLTESPVAQDEEESDDEEEEADNDEDSEEGDDKEEEDEDVEETEEIEESKSPSRRRQASSPAHSKTKNVLRELQEDFPIIIKEGEDVLRSEQKLQMFKSKILENLRMLTEKSVEALAETEAEYTLLVKKFNMISFTRPEETDPYKIAAKQKKHKFLTQQQGSTPTSGSIDLDIYGSPSERFPLDTNHHDDDDEDEEEQHGHERHYQHHHDDSLQYSPEIRAGIAAMTDELDDEEEEEEEADEEEALDDVAEDEVEVAEEEEDEENERLYEEHSEEPSEEQQEYTEEDEVYEEEEEKLEEETAEEFGEEEDGLGVVIDDENDEEGILDSMIGEEEGIE